MKLRKRDFAYDVSALTGYTDELGGELITGALVGATTPSVANVRLGIKGTQSINILDSTPVFQAGACGLSPTGSTVFSAVDLTVCPETVYENLCYKDLYDTYQSMLMSPGQTSETVPFVDMIADLKTKQIQQRVEEKLWKATKIGGDCFDGFDTVIAATHDNVASVSGTTFSSSAAYGADGNPLTEVDRLINGLSDDAQQEEDLVCFMSFTNFRKYVQALTRANFFANYVQGAEAIGGQSSAQHPNANVKVIPTIGLNGNDNIVLGPAKYFIVGFDLLSDSEKLNIWYSKDNDDLRIRANYNYGAAIPEFGNDKIYFTINGL